MNSDKLKTLFPADEICTDLKKNQTNQKQTPKQNKKETQTKQTLTPPHSLQGFQRGREAYKRREILWISHGKEGRLEEKTGEQA